MPAFNEEKVICNSIRALLASTVQEFEIVVVDDGSTDRTAEAAREAFAGNERVRVFTKANGGKATALNYGLQQTAAEIVIFLDADTLFAPDAIEWLVRHFADPRVGAVAGAIDVGNPVNLITRFQSLEYITSQNLDRRAMEVVNAIQVVPGCIGVWRREALLAVGGFPENTMAEDADATIAIERGGWLVLTEPRAKARTEAPETLRAFLKQRFRWMFGTLQAAFKHRHALFTGNARGVAYVTLPNIILFQFLFALVSPILDLALLWALLSALWAYQMHPGPGWNSTLLHTAPYWLYIQSIEIAAASIAFYLDGNRRAWRLLPMVVLQRFCYRQLIYWIAIRTAFSALKGRLVNWGKLARTGHVVLPGYGSR
jgi:cellulose synthase/poly-beta-1,6-N-acetylglucosamine synthase-like glycosyltransferase